jgi:hypothetical protein
MTLVLTQEMIENALNKWYGRSREPYRCYVDLITVKALAAKGITPEEFFSGYELIYSSSALKYLNENDITKLVKMQNVTEILGGKMVTVKCGRCKKPVFMTPAQYKQRIEKALYNTLYCSGHCAGRSSKSMRDASKRNAVKVSLK